MATARSKALKGDEYVSTKGGMTGRVKVPHKYAEKMKDKESTKHIKSFMKKFD